MIYVMSDIHGCFDKYKEMLSLIEFLPRDTLYVLGDVIDRGPDGIKILQDMMLRPNVFPLLGNHEFTAAVCLPWLMEEVTGQSLATLDETQFAALGEWIANGGGPTLRSLKELSQDEREDILEYFREMELCAEVETGGRFFVLIHSAPEHFASDKSLDSYDLQDFLFGRPEADAAYYPEKFWFLATLPPVFWAAETKFSGGRLGLTSTAAVCSRADSWAVCVWIRWKNFMCHDRKKGENRYGQTHRIHN